MRGMIRKVLGPFSRRFEAMLDRVVYASVSRAIREHEPTRAMGEDVTLVLDAVLAEQFRLQGQVEELSRLLAEARGAIGGE